MHIDAVSTCKTDDFVQSVQWLGFVLFFFFPGGATITISNLEENPQDCGLPGECGVELITCRSVT